MKPAMMLGLGLGFVLFASGKKSGATPTPTQKAAQMAKQILTDFAHDQAWSAPSRAKILELVPTIPSDAANDTMALAQKMYEILVELPEAERQAFAENIGAKTFEATGNKRLSQATGLYYYLVFGGLDPDFLLKVHSGLNLPESNTLSGPLLSFLDEHGMTLPPYILKAFSEEG
jgi:hypothetical protein